MDRKGSYIVQMAKETERGYLAQKMNSAVIYANSKKSVRKNIHFLEACTTSNPMFTTPCQDGARTTKENKLEKHLITFSCERWLIILISSIIVQVSLSTSGLFIFKTITSFVSRCWTYNKTKQHKGNWHGPIFVTIVKAIKNTWRIKQVHYSFTEPYKYFHKIRQ